MKYKGYTIDRDNLGRVFVCKAGLEGEEYAEDRVYIPENTIKGAKAWASAEAWKHAPRKCYTICYGLYDERDDDFFTATWFAYGRDKEEAKEKFLADFHRHPEDFYGATPETQIAICNVVEGFSC